MGQETVESVLERKSVRKRFIRGNPVRTGFEIDTFLRMRRGLRRMVRRNRTYKVDSTDILWASTISPFWKTIAFVFLLFCEVLVIYLEIFPPEPSLILVFLTGAGYIGLLIIDSWLVEAPTDRKKKSRLRRKRRLRRKIMN
ncbi:MAG: hypothetical protein ACFFD4_23960 [Candidatus Odinarchaeota archaeon]